MEAEHKCGPDEDAAFFDEVLQVFNKHPDSARNYAVRCIDHETDLMGIDFEKQRGVMRIEDDNKTIIKEFQFQEAAGDDENLETESAGGIICCEWVLMSGGTRWKCVSTWA